MKIRDLVRKTEKFATDNSPAILTVVGVTGAVTAAYLTGKASFKAAEIIDREESRGGTADDPKKRFKERAQLTWKLYIPAATTLVITVASIVCANRIGTRRTAAMASALTLSDRAFSEYKEKVIEQIGQNKEQKVRDAVAQDRVDKSPVGKTEVIVTGGGEVLCHDQYTGRYFQSSMEAIKKAQNDTNYQILNNFYASLNDFYSRLGVERVSPGDDVGWNSDNLMEIFFSTTMSDDGRPCISISFTVDPIRGFHRVY